MRYGDNRQTDDERKAQIEKVERSLFERYGYYLTLKDLAGILKRAPQGLRVSTFEKTPTGDQLRAAKLKVGRTLRFDVKKVAEMLVA
jgi:hypothetical protein